MNVRLSALFIGLCLVMAACAPGLRVLDSALVPTAEALLATASPMPDFVWALRQLPARDGDPPRQCLDMVQAIIYSPEGRPAEMRDYPDTNVRLSLDGQPVKPNLFDSGVAQYDDRGAFVAYEGQARLCFDLDTLAPGLHMAAVAVTNLAGEELVYVWALRVAE